MALATLVVLAGGAFATQAVTGRAVTGPSFTITAPSGWKDQPAVAAMARKQAEGAGALPAGAKLHVVAFGDLSIGAFAVVTEVDTPSGQATPRASVDAFHVGVRQQLEASGLTITTWTVRDDGKVSSAAFAGTLRGMQVVGANLALVDDKDLLRGVSSVCLTKDDDRGLTAVCGGVLASLASTVPTKSVKSLGKRP